MKWKKINAGDWKGSSLAGGFHKKFVDILRDCFSVEIYKKIFGMIFWGILVERFNILQMDLRCKPNFTAGNCWTNAIHGANFISTLNYEHVYMWMFSPVTEKPAHHELMNGRDY